MIDFWAHHYAENQATESIEDDDFDQEDIERKWAQQAAELANSPPDDFEDVT
jgi:hypothetical protein